MTEPVVETVKRAARDVSMIPSDWREFRWGIAWALIIAVVSLAVEDLVWIPLREWLR